MSFVYGVVDLMGGPAPRILLKQAQHITNISLEGTISGDLGYGTPQGWFVWETHHV